MCNNIEDVYRLEELLKDSISIDSDLISRQDYIEKPTAQGYRALHINLRLYMVEEGFGFDLIPCEIQIRSRLQDAWAELSHDDIYKRDGLPPDLRDRAKDLAELLATADATATSVRARVQRLTQAPKYRPTLDRVSSDALVYVFKDVFGRAPPAYILTEALNLCDKLGIGSLTNIPSILKRQGFRDKLADAYRASFPLTIPQETIFLAALHALAQGDRRALRYVRREAQREFKEIDAVARREMLSAVPVTPQALIEELEDRRGETDIVSLAVALGVGHKCWCCGAPIIDPYEFAEAATQHYDLSGDEADEVFERIEQALYASDIDTGGLDDSSLCSHCAWQMTKDD